MRIRALVCLVSLALFPSVATAVAVTGDVGSVSSQINIPVTDIGAINPSYIQALDPAKAVGLNVVGATGGLTHPACIAETIRRANMKPPQPPPAGDFPCIVPAASGIVDGVCFVNVCKGIASTGLDGIMAALKSIGSLGGIVSGILSKLIQGGSSAPDSSAPSVSEPATPVVTPPASQSIAREVYQSPDMSLLFSQSRDIVQDLLRSLRSPDVQVPRAD